MYLRTIQGVLVVAAVVMIDAAAVVVAVIDGKLSNLLIGAAMVASNAMIFGRMVDRRLGDTWDARGRHEQRKQEARRV